MTYPIQKTEDEWQALLQAKGAEPAAYQVTRHAATERPFSGKYERVWANGSYHCICCGNLLFDAATKFDAGCGWPSFSKPIDPTPPLVVKPIDDPTKLPKTSESGKPKDAISDLLNGTRGAGEKSPATSTAVAPFSTERGVAEVRPSKPGAYLRLSVQPWGRVIVDGQDKGISPPVTRIWLPEGEHRIVLENDNQQRHSDTVRIVDKMDLALSHKF